MIILITTDAWHPQINGVAITLSNTIKQLQAQGHNTKTIIPNDFKTHKIPYTNDISLPLYVPHKKIKDKINWAEYIHISTEGPIGLSTRNYCHQHKLNYTTAYHTDIPGFIKNNIGIGTTITKQYLKWFHQTSNNIMTTTPQNAQALKEYGITAPTSTWIRGVDTNLFKPIQKDKTDKIKIVYCGRISPEKGIKDFLELDIRYQKTIIGDGISLNQYQQQHPEINFTGQLTGQKLANELANHDIFVFPSKFDTFGLVILEAMACGLPIACYDTKGPGEINKNHPEIGQTIS